MLVLFLLQYVTRHVFSPEHKVRAETQLHTGWWTNGREVWVSVFIFVQLWGKSLNSLSLSLSPFLSPRVTPHSFTLIFPIAQRISRDCTPSVKSVFSLVEHEYLIVAQFTGNME